MRADKFSDSILAGGHGPDKFDNMYPLNLLYISYELVRMTYIHAVPFSWISLCLW